MESSMEPSVIYDVVPRDPQYQRGAWILNGKFFNFADGRIHQDGEVIDGILILSLMNLPAAKIEGLVMTSIEGGSVADLVPRH